MKSARRPYSLVIMGGSGIGQSVVGNAGSLVDLLPPFVDIADGDARDACCDGGEGRGKPGS